VSKEKALQRGIYGTYPTLRLQGGITDDNGIVRCVTAAALGSAGIRVTGDSILAELVELRAAPSGTEPFVVRVRRGAIIAGVIEPAKTILAWGPTQRQRAGFALLAGERKTKNARFYMPKIRAVQITTAGKPQRLPMTAVNEDGSFRIAAVPPGSWRLVLHCLRRKPSVLGEVHDLRAGERRNLELSVAALSPVCLQGTALLDGVKVPRGNIRFATARASIKAGAFEFERLPAGRYWPALEVEDGRLLFLEEPIELGPGQTYQQVFTFVRRRLELRILSATGKPVRGRLVSLRIRKPKELNGSPVLRPERTDAEGRVVFDPAPPFPVEVLVWHEEAVNPDWWNPDTARDASTALGPVIVGSAKRKVVELRMR
jgi:hypothetical protein